MSKLILFDFECRTCGDIFEDLVKSDKLEVPCSCGGIAVRTISGTHLDPAMGLTNDFPTMARKWEKRTRQRAKIDNVDGPNLWMY